MAHVKSLRFVSYAVNGRGIGHLIRQVAIHRWIRRYTTFAGVRSEHWFLTTSEADTLLHHHGFAGFKLPSKSVVESAGIEKTAYIALAKQWVWHSFSLLRPDVFIADTFPEGSFGELPSALDLCPHPALVLRPVKDEFADSPRFRAALGLYERIIIPTDDDEARDAQFWQLATVHEARVRRVGPISLVDRFSMVDVETARTALGIPPGKTALLVTGGGGGDEGVDALFSKIIELSAGRDDVHLVLAAGPLYRGKPWHGPGLTFFAQHGLSRWLSGIDVAVSAAGYNAAHELLHAGVPSLFVPQEKIADDQFARAQRYVDAGVALWAPLEAEPDLSTMFSRLMESHERDRLRHAIVGTGIQNDAARAARRVLELVLPRRLVTHAGDVLQETLLRAAEQAAVPLETLVDLAIALDPSALQERANLELEPAMELVERTRPLGLQTADLLRVSRALVGKRCTAGLETEQIADWVAELVGLPACVHGPEPVLRVLAGANAHRAVRLDEIVTYCKQSLIHGEHEVAIASSGATA